MFLFFVESWLNFELIIWHTCIVSWYSMVYWFLHIHVFVAKLLVSLTIIFIREYVLLIISFKYFLIGHSFSVFILCLPSMISQICTLKYSLSNNTHKTVTFFLSRTFPVTTIQDVYNLFLQDEKYIGDVLSISNVLWNNYCE